MPAVLALSLCFEVLEPLNLHHKVEALLLLAPLHLKSFVLSELLVADGHHFRVQHHCVHLLHVVFLLVELALGLAKQPLVLGGFGYFVLRARQFVGAVLVHLLHASFALVAGKHLLLLLLTQHSLGLLALVLSGDGSGGTNHLKLLL